MLSAHKRAPKSPSSLSFNLFKLGPTLHGPCIPHSLAFSEKLHLAGKTPPTLSSGWVVGGGGEGGGVGGELPLFMLALDFRDAPQCLCRGFGLSVGAQVLCVRVFTLEAAACP